MAACSVAWDVGCSLNGLGYSLVIQWRKVLAACSVTGLMAACSGAGMLAACSVIPGMGGCRVLVMDIHSGQCVGYFDIPVDHVYGEVGAQSRVCMAGAVCVCVCARVRMRVCVCTLHHFCHVCVCVHVRMRCVNVSMSVCTHSRVTFHPWQ